MSKDRKLKILMISTNPILKDGITSVIFNIAENIDYHKFQVDIMAINKPDTEFVNRISACGGKIYTIKRGFKCIIKYALNLKRLIKKNKYDIVHIHGNSHTLALELTVAKLAGAKIRIAHSHNTTCKVIFLNKLLAPIFNFAYTDALACGTDAGKWMFGRKDFTIFNNGINIENFMFNKKDRIEIRKKYNILDNEVIIGHVGRFNTQKNHVFLIEIIKCLLKTKQNYKLFLIGDGQLKDEIEKLVYTTSLSSNVFFLGAINDVGAYLSAMDMIVMPSLYEGFPVTLVEEQVNGLNCIVSNTITNDVNITGNVVFVPLNNNPELWADTIESIDVENDRSSKSNQSVKAIIDAGLDMKKEIRKLEKYYKKACDRVYDN